MATIPVNSPDGVYEIVIQSGVLTAEVLPVSNPVVITNTTVRDYHAAALAERLKAGIAVAPDGEQYKNLETVTALYGDLIAAGADRSSTVVVVGGGVIGDMAGFVAATYMRGVDFVQVPTTLLSMVDSSVGGKVGVDLPQGKNLVGAFKQPRAIYIDPDVLATLPAEEWRNGMAEVIKHGFIADETLLDPALHQLDAAEALVTKAVQVKVDVVQRDPYEKGERAFLNLGHTFGHAIEQVTGYAWAHGYAVGFGLMAAAHLSYALKLCDAALVDTVDQTLAAVGLPRRLGQEIDTAALWQAMHTDKKWKNGVSHFVLLRGIGQPMSQFDVPRDVVIQILEALR
jgi:3-dehydroquinate synthase